MQSLHYVLYFKKKNPALRAPMIANKHNDYVYF